MWELPSLRSWGHWVVSGHREGVQWEPRVSEVMSSPGSPRDRRSMLPRINTRLRLCGTCVLRGWSKWAMQLFPWRLEKGGRISSDSRKEEVDIGGFQLRKVGCPVPFLSLDNGSIRFLMDPCEPCTRSWTRTPTRVPTDMHVSVREIAHYRGLPRHGVPTRPKDELTSIPFVSTRPVAQLRTTHQANYQHATTYTHIRLDQDP